MGPGVPFANILHKDVIEQLAGSASFERGRRYFEELAGVSAETTISRKEFGLTWNAALEAGGVLVSDKVKINLELSFLAPSAS